MPSCTLVVTGAPLAARATDLIAAIQRLNVDVDFVLTPASTEWVSEDELLDETGAAARTSSWPSAAKRLPLPDAVVIAPATFNTISKSALGIADTRAHSFICECIAARVPSLLVPMINDRLWNHPALAGHLDNLRRAGATFADVRTGKSTPTAVESGAGQTVVDEFDPSGITRFVTGILGRSC